MDVEDFALPKAFRTGFPEVDEGHERIGRFLANLMTAIESSDDDERVARIARDFYRFLVVHFQQEEVLLANLNDSFLHDMTADHRRVLERAREILLAMEQMSRARQVNGLFEMEKAIFHHACYFDSRFQDYDDPATALATACKAH